MFSPRWNKVLRDLTSHKVRTLLVVLSIAVGVFAVSVVMGGRQILLREFDVDYAASVPPSAEFYTTGFDQSLVQRVASRNDVRAAEGRRRISVRYTRHATPGESTAGWETMNIWAVPDFQRAGVNKIVQEDVASWPPGPGELYLERSALQVGKFSVGETLTVETPEGTRVDLRIAGLVHDINSIPAQFQGAETGFIAMNSLPLLKQPEELNHLSIVTDPTFSRAAVSRIAANVRDTDLAAAGVNVLRMSVPKPGSHFLGDIFKALSLLLLAIGVMALSLSGFLVVTTVQAIMAQQVRQVGIMKAVGGRRTQIAWMYVALVAMYGALAVVLGMFAGRVAGLGLVNYAAGVLNFRVTDFTPPAWVLVLDVLVGMLVPILAAAIPVHQGTTMPVVRALNAGATSARFGHGLVDRALGLIRGLPRPVALSLRNTFLRKGRLALTLTTLVLASAVVMAVISVRSSMLQTVEDMGSWWNYDAQVFMARPQPRADLEREAARVKGVTAVETWLESAASLARPDGSENEGVFALGVPIGTRFIIPNVVAGRWLEPTDKRALVLNTDVLKDEPYLHVGDYVTLKMRGKEARWKIVGVASGQLMGPVAFVSRDDLDSALGANGAVTRLLVQSSEHTPDTQSRISSELERRLNGAGLSVSGAQTQTAQKGNIANELGILVKFLVIMASLLAAVGVIGLTGTMTINVLESTREIGVMRSIGASHQAIFGIYITEGVVIATMAWLVGALLSWPFSVVLTEALGTAMSLPLSYSFSWLGVWDWLATVTAIAVVASLLPAWRASQVSIRDAIAYE
jgi:putative ABC transport system permease protein